MTVKLALLKEAENKVREGGYNNFSFRELATKIGIKSASVHYHFPTKEDLGAELARYYTDNFMNALGDPYSLVENKKHPIDIYVDQFRHAILVDKRMCLCGVFASETDCLPDKIKQETTEFFNRNIQWLTNAYVASGNCTTLEAEKKAIQTLALLEGAMLIVKASEKFDKSDAFFEQACEAIQKL